MRHTQPGYVLEGTLTLEHEPTTDDKAGEVFYIDAGKIHVGINDGTAPSKFLVTKRSLYEYTAQSPCAGKPGKQMRSAQADIALVRTSHASTAGLQTDHASWPYNQLFNESFELGHSELNAILGGENFLVQAFL